MFHEHPNLFVNHIHLKIGNLNRSLEFYTKVLGFQMIEQHGGVAKLSACGEKALITLEQPMETTPLNPRDTGLFHIAYLLPRNELANILRHLINIGYPLQGASDHLVSEALYLADPDGNGIELYADRESDVWKWENNEVQMSTLPLNTDDLLKMVDKESWTGMPSDTIIGHIHLQVSDLEKAREFYTEGLGFDVVSRYGNQAFFLSSGGYHHHIGLNTWNSLGGATPSETSIGMKSYSISVPSGIRDSIVKRLKDNGFIVETDGAHYRSEDPSGHVIYF